MESMKRMGLSYIDVVQIHDVEHAPSLEYLEKETIPALLKLKEKGLIKAIGVTGEHLPTGISNLLYSWYFECVCILLNLL